MIEFKTEDSLWQMLADGTKTWDARKWDMADHRIYRLAREGLEADGSWTQEVKYVSFANKLTGEVLEFRLKSLQFATWAPGWVFLILGARR